MFHMYYFLQPFHIYYFLQFFLASLTLLTIYATQALKLFFFRDGVMSRYCYCVTWIYVTRIYGICNSEFPDELGVRVQV